MLKEDRTNQQCTFCAMHDQQCRDIRTLLDNKISNEKDLRVIFDSISSISELIKDHVFEADREGGVRDRVKILETTVKSLDIKKVLLAGAIGGFFSRSPDAMNAISHWITNFWR